MSRLAAARPDGPSPGATTGRSSVARSQDPAGPATTTQPTTAPRTPASTTSTRRPSSSARALRGRVPVHPRAALAHLLDEPVEPILAPLPDEERDLLRTHLDDALFIEVLGRLLPRDLLGSPSQRARALASRVPPGGVVMAASALWVHTGVGPPSSLRVAHPGRRGGSRALLMSRTRIPERDVVVLAGVRCTSLARAAVDVARTAPPALAVQAVLLAQAAGLGRYELGLALDGCLGADRKGRPRALKILTSLVGTQEPER